MTENKLSVGADEEGGVTLATGPVLVRLDWMAAIHVACALRQASIVAAYAVGAEPETWTRVATEAAHAAAVDAPEEE